MDRRSMMKRRIIKIRNEETSIGRKSLLTMGRIKLKMQARMTQSEADASKHHWIAEHRGASSNPSRICGRRPVAIWISWEQIHLIPQSWTKEEISLHLKCFTR
jgi:hypothetical protein